MTIDVMHTGNTGDDLTITGEPLISRPGRRLGRAQWALLTVVAASALMSAGGLIGAAWVKSPAQVAAETGPPSPSLLTATITRQEVSKTLISRGVVMAAHQVQATPDSEPGAERLVITTVDAHAGSEVYNGDVLLTVTDQPIFALAGAVPAWRNLTPGESGSDVAELQAALAELGYSSSPDASGYFGAGTKSAVSAFFSRIGFPVPDAGESSAQLQRAWQALISAEDKLAADRRLADRSGAQGRAARARLPGDESAVTTAQRSYDSQAGHSGPMVPLNDVVFVPSFPATVAALSGQRGALVQPPLVTIDSGRPDVAGQFDPSDESLIRPGQVVVVQDQASGWQAPGLVQAVGAVTTGSGKTGGSSSASAAYLPVTVRLAGKVPLSEIGQNVELTVTYAHSAGAVLTVPEAAIRSDTNGQTYVIMVGGHGTQRRVPVVTGITGNGMVAVRARRGRLSAGEHVVTGS